MSDNNNNDNNKKRSSPCRPGGGGTPKLTDTSKLIGGELLLGFLMLITFCNASGTPAFTNDIVKSVVAGKQQQLEIMRVVNYKNAEGKFVMSGKKEQYEAKAMITYTEDTTEGKAQLKQIATTYANTTKPYSAGQKISAKAGLLKDASGTVKLEDRVSTPDTVEIVKMLFPNAMEDRLFDNENEEDLKEVVNTYFSNTPFEEAKQLLQNAFEEE